MTPAERELLICLAAQVESLLASDWEYVAQRGERREAVRTCLRKLREEQEKQLGEAVSGEGAT